MRYLHPEALVDSDWLARRQADPDLLVFECTTYLDYLPPGAGAPYDVRSGRDDYLGGHLPGAAFLDIQGQLSDPASPAHLRFTLPPLDHLAEMFAAVGIGDGTRVVLYSRNAPQWASRVWWMLRAVGFDDAALLDGGLDGWVARGYALETTQRQFPPASLTLRARPSLFVGRDAVRSAMEDGRTCVINALAPDLHRGENPRYGRAGRIPGSHNVPAAALTEPDGQTLVDAQVATRRFQEVGADPSRPVLVYCGGGIAATLDAFVLHRLGYQDLAVYDASMSEWARDESLPLESG